MLIVLVSLDVHICTRFNHCMTDNKNTLLKEMHHVDFDTDIVMILKTNCKFNVLHFQMIYKMNMSCFLYFYLFIFFLNNTDTCKCREKSKEKQTLFMIFLINVDSE